MDNPKANLQRKGSSIPLESSQILWSSDRSTKDLRSAGGSPGKNDKDKDVNVQVVLRCRPLSEDEKRAKTPVAISCNEHSREVSVIQNVANKYRDKAFVFDNVFGPASQQKDLYEQAIAPLVNEALEGYTCTIFAYGQTGTGKTYTMEGEAVKQKKTEFHNDAGVIPRAVKQIFDTLEAQNAEYGMKVTFLELYHEDITDLLVPEKGSRKPITVMEDGKGAVFVKGLEEGIVHTADEIYKILEEGSMRKHIAEETLLNKQSNRSHSILSITVEIKECASEGVELIKCGKLNLVDLAGSENVLRSGAREERAREAGEINKSLLTLGRVINALVEHSGHVPYRDSNLTRLLRDSLGGETKTCMIATISPSVYCLEETLSTLEYAYRAKNIRNRPEVNQRVTKSALINDLYMEIDRLKQELRENYLNEEAVKKATDEEIEHVKLESEFKNKQLTELQELYVNQQKLFAELSEKLGRTQREFDRTKQAMVYLVEKQRRATETIKEKEDLIFNLLGSEKALTEKAFELRAELEKAASEVSSLLAEIDRKNKMEDSNRVLIHNFRAQLAQQLASLHTTVDASVKEQEKKLKVVEEETQLFVSTKAMATEQLTAQLEELKVLYGSSLKYFDDLEGELHGNSESAFSSLKSEISKNSTSLMDLFRNMASEGCGIIDDLQNNLNDHKEKIVAFAQQQHEAHTRTLRETRLIAATLGKFFQSISMSFENLTLLVEEAHKTNDQELCAFEKQLEESANEDRQLLDKVTEMLASSNDRKRKMVQTAVDAIRKSATSRMSKLHQEMSNIHDSTTSVQEEWTEYIQKLSTQFIEDISVVESGKDGLEDGLRYCVEKAKTLAEQWRNAEESLSSLERITVDSVDSIVKDRLETNQTISAQFSSIALSTMDESDEASKSCLSSIENLLRLDQDTTKKINSFITPCRDGALEMEIAVSHKTIEVVQNAQKCLIDEYMVDELPRSTPQKQPFDLPSTTSIEELKTPAFESLKSHWDTRPIKQLNGDINKPLGLSEAAQSLHRKFSITDIN
ncbi:kinesin-like protein KIN-5D [Rhododendron vialii]|uniref:kinesin-like protein KIN-5D n=1 Tax=Rhododendron vialii TaxID=182163 RepID=UPI00265EDB23|nr:kinesin-like protein KIN-5D [Rhododendron vialii]